MGDHPIQVLIVDDEESLRAPLARWLAEEYHYTVETAADGLEALELLEARSCFDVFLLDYALPPPFNGLKLMKEIKRRCRDRSMDFIIFTGWGLEPQVGVEALKAGAYRYLAKPFDREELAILIQSVVEIRQTKKELERASREKAWLESLLEVSRSINSTLEIDQVLQLILDEMKRVVIYNSASIQFMTDQGLQIIACQGFRQPERVMGRVFPPSDDYPNYRVWKSGQALIEPEIRLPHQTRRFDGWMGVPLIHRGKAIGVIALDSRTPGFYDQDDARVATVFANQAAIAIENARLHQQTRNRANALQQLLEVGQQISRVTERPKGILETIASMACQVVGADCAVIYPFLPGKAIYDKTNIASFGLRHELNPSEKLREYGKSVAARIIQEPAGTCIVSDVVQDTALGFEDSPLRNSPFIRREGIEAFVAIRLDFGRELVGVLFANFRSPHRVTQEELEIIQLFANQAAVAIWNARVYGRTSDRLEQKLTELQTVNDINQLITSTLDLNEVLPLILDKAMELLHVQHGVLQLIEEETGELVIQLRKGPVPVPSEHPRLKPGEGITGKAAQEKRSIIVHDVTQLPWRTIYHELWPETRSELAVPLLIGEQCIGVLNLEHPEPGFFSEDEREVLEGLAAQAAIAIHNARLYEAVKRRSEHLKALHEASKAITAGFAVERNRVLDRITRQAVERITGLNGPKALWGAITLYDEAANEIQFESIYSPTGLTELEYKLGDKSSLDRNKAAGGRIGIAGRAVLEGRSLRVNDVLSDPDYIPFHAGTKSELDVPLLDGDKVIGVLGVGSDEPGAFDGEDEQALRGLADLAVIAIKNADQLERLNRADAVALMGAWGADIAHDVNREVGAIRRAVYVLRQRPELADEVRERLEDIDRYAGGLALPELPAQAPQGGSVLEFTNAPLLDQVIQAQIHELRSSYAGATLHLEQNCTGTRVAIHDMWLRRLVRHLVRNSLNAASPEREEALVITVRTLVLGSIAEVQVEDTGKGVQPEIGSLLFRQPVHHPDGRLGRGLLLVRFLAEQHGGYARLVWSQPGKGACFAFGVPLAQTV